MVIRGAAGRKIPYGRVQEEDNVFLIENNGDGLIKAQGLVKSVFFSKKLSPEETQRLLDDNQAKLQLSSAQIKRWENKRYLSLIELKDVYPVSPFSYVRESNMDDWIMVEQINSIKK